VTVSSRAIRAGPTGAGACPAAVGPTQEVVMGDKSPKKPNAKKPGKSLKEKRAEKQLKNQSKRPGTV
jgi:hypothetical protein